jgi:hypothetical protein
VNRETRNKIVSGTGPDLTSGNACWETAPLAYADICRRFACLERFTIDLTADAGRALEGRYFGPGSPIGVDALAVDWSAHGFDGFSNPPYGPFIRSILEKAIEQKARGFTSVFLIPLRITKAFQRFALAEGTAAEIWFADKRLVFFEDGAPRISFDKRGKPRPDAALFDSCLVVYRPGHTGRPAVGLWTVPAHVTAEDLARAEARARLRPRKDPLILEGEPPSASSSAGCV